ncbi:hypothetical protein DERP_004151, partial [Dermatophagoides pteronyssinus]
SIYDNNNGLDLKINLKCVLSIYGLKKERNIDMKLSTKCESFFLFGSGSPNLLDQNDDNFSKQQQHNNNRMIMKIKIKNRIK